MLLARLGKAEAAARGGDGGGRGGRPGGGGEDISSTSAPAIPKGQVGIRWDTGEPITPAVWKKKYGGKSGRWAKLQVWAKSPNQSISGPARKEIDGIMGMNVVPSEHADVTTTGQRFANSELGKKYMALSPEQQKTFLTDMSDEDAAALVKLGIPLDEAGQKAIENVASSMTPFKLGGVAKSPREVHNEIQREKTLERSYVKQRAEALQGLEKSALRKRKQIDSLWAIHTDINRMNATAGKAVAEKIRNADNALKRYNAILAEAADFVPGSEGFNKIMAAVETNKKAFEDKLRAVETAVKDKNGKMLVTENLADVLRGRINAAARTGLSDATLYKQVDDANQGIYQVQETIKKARGMLPEAKEGPAEPPAPKVPGGVKTPGSLGEDAEEIKHQATLKHFRKLLDEGRIDHARSQLQLYTDDRDAKMGTVQAIRNMLKTSPYGLEQ